MNMKFDEETLIEIEDYIQALDEQIGLKPETMRDIEKAINKHKSKLKKCSIPHVNNLVCPVCKGSKKALNVKYDLPCQVCNGTGQACY